MSYYAVKVGHITGVFDSWDVCQSSIKGYSGADFKKFSTLPEAEAYIVGIDLYSITIKSDIENGYVVAFCDGSYDNVKKRYSYGVLIIDHNFQEYEICGSAKNEKYVSSQNIIGEILGAINAMDWAISNGYNKLKIYHDYEGLSKWLSGEWAPKSDVASMYCSVYTNKYKDLVQVDFEKVKGHSNNKYNNKADELASRALSENSRVPITGDSWFSIPYFKADELQAIFDLLSSEHPQSVINISEKHNSITYKMVLDGNRLVVTLFQNGNKKLLVQGKNSVLFQIFITYVNELIGVNAEHVFSDAYRKNIDSVKIDTGMQSICPVFPVDYPDNIKRLIRQSIINLNYFVECEDYSQYIFPSLRALEGHMKYLFKKEGIIATYKQPIGGYFQKDQSSDVYYLTIAQISDPVIKTKLEKYYNYYNKTRHTLFHFGDLLGGTDTTRIIETKSLADEEIKICLSYLCEE